MTHPFGLNIPDLTGKADNPFVRYHVGRNATRRSERIYTPKQGRRLLWLLTATFTLISIIFVLIIVNYSGSLRSAYYAASQVRDVLLLACIGMSAIIDLYILVTTINYSGLHSDAGKWESIELTGITPQRVIDGSHQIALARAWPICILEMALRASLIVMLLASTIVSELYNGDSNLWNAILSSQVLVYVPVYLVLYFEPVWRMRYVTAFALRLAARSHDLTTLIFVYLRAFFYLRIMQFAIMVCWALIALLVFLLIGLSTGIVIGWSTGTRTGSNFDMFDVLLNFGMTVTVCFLMWFSYRREMRRALKIAAHDLFRHNDQRG